MVSGAVIIGRPSGPNMIGAFDLIKFFDLREKVGLHLIMDHPVEVAYPYSFEKENQYHEGILINVWGGEEIKNSKMLEDFVGGQLILSAQRAETIKADYFRNQGKISKPWNSDFCYQNIATQKSEAGDIEWVPFFKVLETYNVEDARDIYVPLAKGLLEKTREARIRNCIEREKAILEDRMIFLDEKIKSWK